MTFRDSPLSAWPTVDEAGMREVDRIMIEDLGVDLLQMMENAGRSLATLAVERFEPRRVAILAGSGGNGGGGMAAARHLANRGVDVRVHLSTPSANLTAAAARQRLTLLASGVHVEEPEVPIQVADLVVDAMIGYSLRGEPEGHVEALIDWTRRARTSILSLDVPSGFSARTGRLSPRHVVADATLTLAAPKVGLAESPATGELFVADISVPPHVFDRWNGARRPDFGMEWIVRIVP